MRSLLHLRSVLIVLAAMALSACDSGDDGQAHIRLLNASPGYPSLDLYFEDDDGNEDLRLSGVVSDTVSDYAGLNSGTYAVKLRRNGITSTLLTVNGQNLADDSHATYVAFGSSGHFGVLGLGEDEDDPDRGDTKVKVLNTAEAGSLDVYFTESSVSLDDASPSFSGIGTGGSSTITTMDSGDYRVRVTGAGDTTDLRLDIPNITLGSERVVSLILTATQGGVLVNALLLPQQGSLTRFDNTIVRVRGAVGIANGTNVTARVGGVGVLSNAALGWVGNYTHVAAGSATVSISVDGNAIADGNQALVAGGEYTLLIWSSASGTQATFISDDNRLPVTVGKAKIRVMNGISALNVPITLAVDHSPTAERIQLGQASPFTEFDGGLEYQIDVSNSDTTAPLHSRSSVLLQTAGVYTMFAFSSGTAVGGTLRKDR